jgi:hypothetical protein
VGIRGERVVGNLALVVLVIALVLTPVLLILTLRTSTASITVGRFTAASCGGPSTSRCYGAVVTNTGDRDTALRCVLVPQGGPPAAFLSGSQVYESGGVLQPGSSLTLVISLQPSEHASPALPLLTCSTT